MQLALHYIPNNTLDHIIFWKSTKRSSNVIIQNLANNFDICWCQHKKIKMGHFRHFKDLNFATIREQITPLFSSFFLALEIVSVHFYISTFFLIWKWWKFNFMGSLFWSAKCTSIRISRPGDNIFVFIHEYIIWYRYQNVKGGQSGFQTNDGFCFRIT